LIRYSTMKKLLLLTSFILFTVSWVQSQAYTTAVGVRFGKGFGMTLNQVFAPGWTMEGIISHRRTSNSTHYVLLAEHHRKLLGRRLNFYLGGGIQGASFDHLDPDSPDNPFGLAAVVGIDFTIRRLNFSFDFQPHYNLKGGFRDFSSDSALSLRYVIIKRIKRKKKKNINWKFWEKDDNKKKKKRRN